MGVNVLSSKSGYNLEQNVVHNNFVSEVSFSYSRKP